MKQQHLKILLFAFTIWNLTACDSTKRLTEGEYLLDKNTVLINDEKDNSETINSLIHQKPNKKILNTPLGLHIYNTARPNKDSLFEVWLNKKPKRRERLERKLSKKQLLKVKESSIDFNNWLKKTGEAPVIVDEQKTKKTVKRLQDYHINNGWFNAKSSYTIDRKDNKRAYITYKTETGTPFIIDSISSSIATPIVDSLYQTFKNKSFIKPNEQYKTTNFELERKRITNELRNLGVYHFKQDYVSVEIDTIGTNKKVNVDFKISNKTVRYQDSIGREPFKIYKIKKVNVFTDNSYANEGKPYLDSIAYKGYTLYSYNKMRYRPKALTDAIFVNPNTIYKDIDRTLTYRHISELRTFKYPNIENIEHADSTLTTNIYLTPLKKFSLGFDAEASQSNIQSVGFSLNPSLQIRNIFKGAETLEISAFGSIGASKDNKNEREQFFDINELGIDFNLTIPRLFSPFNTNKIIPKYMSPSTRISISASSQKNIGLDKQTFSGTFNYNWRPNSKVTNKLDLFNAQYVRNLNPNNYFGVYSTSYNTLNGIAESLNYNGDNNLDYPIQTDAFITDVLSGNTSLSSNDEDYQTVSAINERKNRLTEDNLILSSSFSFTKDKRTNLFDENFSIFRFKVEAAGNLLSNASNLLGLKKDSNDRYELFNVAYSQYIKTELDYVKHWDLGKKNVFAMRSYFGIAIPYGNSSNIPFSKSFFAGGANDNRAWTAYSLGPGSSETTNEFNEANLKIALSLEQRFNIFEDLYGAIFVDTGNIWNALDDVEDDKATFTNFNSLKDIAIGSGFGLRYDFSFFIFRLDVGFKTYDPFYQDKNRWFNDYNFGHAVYNIGINYPF
ncbi:BamA/TamA family outer membrane protein [Postechiella marina]|uniref:BamA/TamA family outer membrane protein n=1 Tax=Postechiella marina TaxID=943941 RepID=A0ABP8CHC9_9FLAO